MTEFDPFCLRLAPNRTNEGLVISHLITFWFDESKCAETDLKSVSHPFTVCLYETNNDNQVRQILRLFNINWLLVYVLVQLVYIDEKEIISKLLYLY